MTSSLLQMSQIRRRTLVAAAMMTIFSGVGWAATQNAQGCGVTSGKSVFGQLAEVMKCLAKPGAGGKSSPAPAPAPTPTPTTTAARPIVTTLPVLAPVTAPVLAGLESVTSGTDLQAYLTPAWGVGAVPGNEAPGVEGAFRFICAPSHLAYDDPIVYPGQPGKAHLHTFFGNTKADANSTYASLRTTGESTCNNLLNRSAYWMPAMMHPSGKVVMPDWVSIYYKRAPASSKYCAPPYATACLALPRGLRYVFGYNMSDPTRSDPAGNRWFNCDGAGAISGRFATIAEAAQGCPAGARLGAVVVGPNCWNGRDLDSADHRSHMTYQVQDGYGRAVCPATHPYLLPFFELGAWFTNDGTAARWTLSSDTMPNMPAMRGGESLHADWFGGWEDSVQALWTANCIDKALSCSGGDLGQGQQLKTLAGYDFPNGRPLMTPPAR